MKNFDAKYLRTRVSDNFFLPRKEVYDGLNYIGYITLLSPIKPCTLDQLKYMKLDWRFFFYNGVQNNAFIKDNISQCITLVDAQRAFVNRFEKLMDWRDFTLNKKFDVEITQHQSKHYVYVDCGRVGFSTSRFTTENIDTRNVKAVIRDAIKRFKYEMCDDDESDFEIVVIERSVKPNVEWAVMIDDVLVKIHYFDFSESSVKSNMHISEYVK